VRVLLDTHVLVWALIEPQRLSQKVRATLEHPAHEILFSAASVWEIAIKAALGKAQFKVAPARLFEAALAVGFVELPVRAQAALKVQTLPHHHRDPFDRLLVAQAIAESAVLYTADSQLARYSDLVELI